MGYLGSIRELKSIWVLLVVLIVVSAATLAGCKGTSAVDDNPVASETVSSEETSSDVSGTPFEEVSEELSVEVSEDPSEETKEVEEVNFSKPDELIEYAKTINDTSIVEYDFSQEGSSQMIIPNGSNYIMGLGNNLYIIPSKEINNIESASDYIVAQKSVKPGVWCMFIYTTGTDIEVSATIKYVDGTKEDILLYVTNTFE